jgi:arsenate reductase-like glutaredoxin family protein
MREVVGSTEDEQLRNIAERPELMQRPILVAGDRAVVGRTAEAVRSLLEAP